MAGPGPLLAADEQLTHQIVDTFARVGQTDRAWTEKVWAMAAATDGTISVAFGMGKYPNRNVLDGFAGVSRGTEQWVVRASRRLAPEPERTEVGPIRYAVVDPLRQVRIALDASDAAPIAFDVVLDMAVPPVLEERETHLSRSRYRVDADVIRFHQSGAARGWVEVDGDRTDVEPAAWVGARDRSWGVRYSVGVPPDDIEDAPIPPGTAGLMTWMPASLQDPEGQAYSVFVYFQRYHGPGWSTGSAQGGVELADGSRLRFASIAPDLRFRDDNRRLVGGTLHCTLTDGSPRDLDVEPLGATGFHLGAGLYGGLEGHWQGEWRGRLHVEGEHDEACDTVEVARRLHQHRDCIVRVRDVTTGGEGYGTLQSIVVGAHPELDLTEAASFE